MQESTEAGTLREQALLLARFLHEHGLLGIQPQPSEREYRHLQHGLISVALCDRRHNSLPLVSAAIYCAVARRIGLDANPINYPEHIYVVISPPASSLHSLDGEQVRHSDDRLDPSRSDWNLFLDPYNGTNEIPYGQLYSNLMAYRLPPDDRRALLGTSKVLARTRSISVIFALRRLGKWHLKAKRLAVTFMSLEEPRPLVEQCCRAPFS